MANCYQRIKVWELHLRRVLFGRIFKFYSELSSEMTVSEKDIEDEIKERVKDRGEERERKDEEEKRLARRSSYVFTVTTPPRSHSSRGKSGQVNKLRRRKKKRRKAARKRVSRGSERWTKSGAISKRRHEKWFGGVWHVGKSDGLLEMGNEETETTEGEGSGKRVEESTTTTAVTKEEEKEKQSEQSGKKLI